MTTTTKTTRTNPETMRTTETRTGDTEKPKTATKTTPTTVETETATKTTATKATTKTNTVAPSIAPRLLSKITNFASVPSLCPNATKDSALRTPLRNRWTSYV
uniref:Uncharacterized protein n=1 Tax=Cacopsylla melanoneura TaxID=428564 RepID=A0A8D8QH46_9HEMI